jgi:hypothetical protein
MKRSTFFGIISILCGWTGGLFLADSLVPKNTIITDNPIINLILTLLFISINFICSYYKNKNRKKGC